MARAVQCEWRAVQLRTAQEGLAHHQTSCASIKACFVSPPRPACAGREARAGNHALALRALAKAGPDSKGKGTEAAAVTRAALDARAAAFAALGWRHWERAERARARVALPPDYPLF